MQWGNRSRNGEQPTSVDAQLIEVPYRHLAFSLVFHSEMCGHICLKADPRFQRQNEPGMTEAGRGTGTGRRQQRAAEAADEERDGLFWDVELVFPTRRRNVCFRLREK